MRLDFSDKCHYISFSVLPLEFCHISHFTRDAFQLIIEMKFYDQSAIQHSRKLAPFPIQSYSTTK